MPKRWRAWRFDLIELGLIVAIVGLAAYLAPRPEPPDEADALEAAYGSARNSENEEEWIIRDFFQDRRDGVFVDVGAAHYKSASNTYYLEHELGWSGIAIDLFVTSRPTGPSIGRELDSVRSLYRTSRTTG
jgi:hypothetical protein